MAASVMGGGGGGGDYTQSCFDSAPWPIFIKTAEGMPHICAGCHMLSVCHMGE